MTNLNDRNNDGWVEAKEILNTPKNQQKEEDTNLLNRSSENKKIDTKPRKLQKKTNLNQNTEFSLNSLNFSTRNQGIGLDSSVKNQSTRIQDSLKPLSPTTSQNIEKDKPFPENQIKTYKDEISRWKSVCEKMRAKFTQENEKKNDQLKKQHEEVKKLRIVSNGLLEETQLLEQKTQQILKENFGQVNDQEKLQKIQEQNQKLEQKILEYEKLIEDEKKSQVEFEEKIKEIIEEKMKTSKTNDEKIPDEEKFQKNLNRKKEESEIIYWKDRAKQVESVIQDKEKEAKSLANYKMEVENYRKLSENLQQKFFEERRKRNEETLHNMAQVIELKMETSEMSKKIIQLSEISQVRTELEKENGEIEKQVSIITQQLNNEKRTQEALEVKKNILLDSIKMKSDQISKLNREKTQINQDTSAKAPKISQDDTPPKDEIFSSIDDDIDDFLSDSEFDDVEEQVLQFDTEKQTSLIFDQEYNQIMHNLLNETQPLSQMQKDLTKESKIEDSKALQNFQQKIQNQMENLEKIKNQLQKNIVQAAQISQAQTENIDSVSSKLQNLRNEKQKLQKQFEEYGVDIEKMTSKINPETLETVKKISGLEKKLVDLQAKESQNRLERNKTTSQIEEQILNEKQLIEDLKIKRENIFQQLEQSKKAHLIKQSDTANQKEENANVILKFSDFVRNFLGQARTINSISELEEILQLVATQFESKEREIQQVTQTLAEQMQSSKTLSEKCESLSDALKRKKKKKKEGRSISFFWKRKQKKDFDDKSIEIPKLPDNLQGIYPSQKSDKDKQAKSDNEKERMKQKSLELIPFDLLLNEEKYCKFFMDFLVENFSEENLLFWKAIEEYKKIDEDELVEAANNIYEKFIKEGSDNQININSFILGDCKERLSWRVPNPEAFSDAQSAVFSLMKTDSYPRFIQSKFYQDLLKNFPQQEWKK
ncbi:hypothetical protein M0811_08204 [Anaeramoeba ignava]|uniref:RGS domain-containing protein n=1 Tax=Anaeramoeba ignava TaxID=1746090 RepID=A0A9Q0RB97_ANAIG|nr:hypothetical protein M0811_08204 [Anaeramoeba ignava]